MRVEIVTKIESGQRLLDMLFEVLRKGTCLNCGFLRISRAAYVASVTLCSCILPQIMSAALFV